MISALQAFYAFTRLLTHILGLYRLSKSMRIPKHDFERHI